MTDADDLEARVNEAFIGGATAGRESAAPVRSEREAFDGRRRYIDAMNQIAVVLREIRLCTDRAVQDELLMQLHDLSEFAAREKASARLYRLRSR